MLVVDGIAKRYGDSIAVSGLSVNIPQGQFVGVIGRSGAGKSTLLRMLNRLTNPSSGRILWDGTDVTTLDGRALRDWRRRCAMIFQQFNLVGRLDVLNNVLMGRLAHTPFWRSAAKVWTREDRALAMAALDQIDIAPLATRRAETLSGGQQQRVAICRTLVQEPDIVLADEPVASLDPRNARIVMDTLQRINRHFGLTVLCNLHSLDLARTLLRPPDRHGRRPLVFDDTPVELTEDVARELYGLEADEVLRPAEPPGAAASSEIAAIA